MVEPPVNSEGWTLGAYIAHNEAIRAMQAKLDDERDRRYTELAASKDVADRAALALARNEVIESIRDLQETLVPLSFGSAEQQGRRAGVGLSANVLASVAGLLLTVAGLVAAVYIGTH